MLTLNLLGPPSVQLNNQDVRIDSLKAQALLYYTAINPRVHSRSSLAGLLWGDSSEEAARRSLRVAVSKLRNAVGDYIIAEYHSISFDHRQPYHLDTAELRKAQSNLPVINPATRKAVLSLRGEFLEDFQVRNAPEFEIWMLSERENIESSAWGLLHALVAHEYEAHNIESSLKYAHQLVALDPWREDAQRWLIQLLAECGQRSAALAQYEECRVILAKELNVEPSTETEALVDAVRAGDIGAPIKTGATPSRSLPAHNLPAAATAFIGRQGELQQIDDLMRQDTCRLLTLLGPGGVGKSRLALEMARQWLASANQPFPDGLFYIPLAGTSLEDDLAQAIAMRLDLLAGSSETPDMQLFTHLSERHMLLILDNFEHLMPLAGWLVDLLAAAPNIKLLVTSQERLALIEAWNLDLLGLSVPKSDTSSAIAGSDAAELFNERACRMNLSFDAEAEGPAIAQICRLVDGNPLALELASAWIRGFSCSEIAKRIQDDLDFLDNTSPSYPARQQSLQAVFQNSWELLTPDQQTAYAQLAIFQGGFTSEAASCVAGAVRHQLLSLGDKSLLRRMPNGRHEIHEYLRQLALVKNIDPDLDTLKRTHANYYADFLSGRANFQQGAEVQDMRQEIAADLDNIRHAWRWGIAMKDESLIDQAMDTLSHFFDLSGLFFEGETLFAQAAAVFPAEGITAALLHYRQSRCAFRLGHNQQTCDLAENALPILEAYGEKKEAAGCLLVWGNAVRDMGDHVTAREHFTRSAALFRELNDTLGLSSATNNLGVLLYYEDDLAGAVDQFRMALDARKQAGVEDVMTELGNIGLCYGEMGAYDEAIEYLEKSRELAQRIGSPLASGLAQHNLGNAYRISGRLELAVNHLTAAIATFREIDSRDALAAALADLGAAYVEMGNYDTAKTSLMEGLELEEILGRPRGMAYKYLGLGNLYLARGDNRRALNYFYRVLKQSEEVIGTSPILNALLGAAVSKAGQDKNQYLARVCATVDLHPQAGYETRQNAQKWAKKMGVVIELDQADTSGDLCGLIAEVLDR